MSEQLYRKLVHYGDTWSAKTWNGLAIFDGNYIWTDGTDYYYSNSSSQYVLDKATSTWSRKTWTGLTSFEGSYVWTDGTDYYYSRGTKQYILDKTTNTWSQKTWTGLTDFNGFGIWTDGDNIYYSYNSDQYILDKATSTWSRKTWNISISMGNRIWTDGTDYYYSSSGSQYVLDKSTGTWSQKTWNGFSLIDGIRVWTAGNDVYFSYDSDQYVLDKSTGTWSAKTWNGLTSFQGTCIWSDGTYVYASYAYSQTDQYQYVLDVVTDYEPVSSPEPVTIPESIKVKDRGGIWYPVKGVSVRTHGGSGSADIASLPPTGAYISSYDPCLAFLGIDAMPKYIGANYSDVDPWEDCSGEYIAEQKAYLSGSPYNGPNNIGDWYFLKVGDRVLAKSNSDSGFAPLIEFTEVPVTGMSLTVGGIAASPGTVILPEGDSPAVQVTAGSDSTKQYYYCNSDWFNSISEGVTDSIGSAYAGGNTLLIEIDPINHTIGIAKYVYEAGN